MKKGRVILATLTGVASGTILGLLFAPDKGAKTRKKISQKGDDYLQKMRKDIDELRGYLNDKVKKTQKEIDELEDEATQTAKTVVEDASEMSNNLEDWTKEELYQRAKKEKISGYSKMNKDELIEALKNN